MTTKKMAVWSLCLTLAACGDGGTSTSGGTGTTSTAVAPTPTPTPPTPVSTTFQTIGVTSDVSGTKRQISPVSSSASVVNLSILDPDSPIIKTLEDVNFNGNETITAQHQTSIGSYSEAFPATSFTGTSDGQVYTNSYNKTTSRVVPSSTWQIRTGASDAAQLSLKRLEKVNKPGSAPTTTHIETQHVKLFDVKLAPYREGLQLVGTPTPTGSVPSSGLVDYFGEFYGFVQNFQGLPGETVGDVHVQVNYQTGQVQGNMVVNYYDVTKYTPGTFSLNFTGSLSGNSIVVQKTLYLLNSPVPFDVQGLIFGPQADELGMIISTHDTGGGTIVLGAVLGK